jgi:ribosome biogenesis GTPase / thiamine phosphate phosphatase
MEIDLEDLGYSAFFESNRRTLGLDGYAAARVTAEYKGSYRIRSSTGEYLATITGKQMFNAVSREDYPAVGDWVATTELGGKQAVIHCVLPRKTVLKRKYSGRFESQVIASNIDKVFVIESVDRDYNPNRIERCLAIADDGGIRPVIVLNKIDLISEPELDSKISLVRKRFKDIDVIKTSVIPESGLDEMAACIIKGETHCLLGSSGVGKSSLINRLLGKDVIKTDTISDHTGKGKHTTTAREMHFLDNGGILIDNPGMREIGMTDSDEGIDETFKEIRDLARRCRFNDCTHEHEPGCAVREAVARGELDEGRYTNYLKLVKEAEYYEMTGLEKRRKDRQFGRFIKKAKKELDK